MTPISVLSFCWSFYLFYFSDAVCSLVAHCVLFAFQGPSLGLYCLSYSFPKQLLLFKMQGGMKGCEEAPLQLLKVHIFQKIVQKVSLLCSNMKGHTL